MDHAPVGGPGGPTTRRKRPALVVRRPYLSAFVVGFVVMAVLVFKKTMTEFEWVYVLSARNLLEGRGLYQLPVPPFRSYAYPPFMALMSVPFALLPDTVARASWFLVNMGCFLGVWWGSWRLSGGGRLEGGGPGEIDRREHTVAAFGLVCALPYLQSGVAHQQTDLLITAQLTLGCVSLTRSRDGLAGVGIGLAAGMKCTPLLWAPYLAWRGRWKAALLVPVVAVGVNLLPDLVRPADGGGTWVGAWVDQFLRPLGRADHVPGQWFAWILDNQSLSGAAGRWASTRCEWRAGGLAIVGRATPWGGRFLRPLTFGAEGAVLMLAWYALKRGRAASGRSPEGAGPLREPTEFGVVLLLMLLLSPMSSRPHFAMTLLPAFCLARLAVREGRRGLFVPLAVTALTAFAALPFWGQSAGRLTMWCGALTWGTLSLLAGCLWALTLAGTSRPGRTSRSAAVGSPVFPKYADPASPRSLDPATGGNAPR